MSHSDALSQAHELTLDMESAKVLPASQTSNFTGLIFNSPPGSDAQPGGNFVILPIEDLGTLLIATASVTELGPDGTAHVGAAVFYTTSVQLDADGQFVRVFFNMEWQWPLPFSLQVIIGHIP
jgi:hypothetical protein